MPELKLLSGRRRRSGPPPKLKPITVLARCRGPGWVAHARHYEHEVVGPFKVWTIGQPGQADVIFAAKLFDWVRFWHECDRKNAEERKQRRAQRRTEKGDKPKGPGERPPAAPRGGGRAA